MCIFAFGNLNEYYCNNMKHKSINQQQINSDFQCADLQCYTQHNMDTRNNHVVLCEHPVTIVNPKLVDFVLYSQSLYYVCENNIHAPICYSLPITAYSGSSREVKRQMLTMLKSMVRHNHIVYFFNEHGECFETTMQVPCGHCLLCSERKRRSFAARCSMECQQHDQLPIFITLTYDDEHLPLFGLCYSDVQKFLKRLRIGLIRDYGYKSPIRYAACGEYGTHTHRPHYHLLLWNMKRDGDLKNVFALDRYIRSKWKNGLTDIRFCGNSDAGYYIGKYFTKGSYLPDNCVKPMHRTSINLGFDFVVKTAKKLLSEKPETTEILYCDKFTGKSKPLPLVTYYINKLFPKYTSIKQEIRDAWQDFNDNPKCWLSDFFPNFMDYYSIPLAVPQPLPCSLHFPSPYRQTDYLPFIDLANRCTFWLSQLSEKVLPNYHKNELIRQRYYNNLFKSISQSKVEDVAYYLRKQIAKEKDKQYF